MSRKILAVLVAATLQTACCMTEVSRAQMPETTSGATVGAVMSPVPPDCPFAPSDVIKSLRFTGRHVEYTQADTWYPSWGSDGNLYSSWTDGSVDGVASMSVGPDATTGHATIVGDDPLSLRVVEQGVHKSDPAPYKGRYPCGNLVFNDIWYYGTYCLGPDGWIERDGFTYNWPWLGPLVGFRYSTDRGATWIETPCTPKEPLFGENGMEGQPIKIGAPHFVDFGKNMEHSPDGKAYLVAHGAAEHDACPRYANHSWITGDQICLLRVSPSVENINDPSKYEFFAGYDKESRVLWDNKLSQARPIAEWNNNMGCVTLTFNATLKKYLMCVTDGTTTVSRYNTYILESDQITGPWKIVAYLKDFGEQAYFVNIPSKFISADGRTMWLCYSANFAENINGAHFNSSPEGSRYAMCLQEITLEMTAPSRQ